MRFLKRVVVAVLVAVVVPLSIAGAGKTPDPLPAPQLVQDAWMFMAAYKADPVALEELLPGGLKPHPNGHVFINMYTVPEETQTSGFGAYNLTYLAIEIDGHDSYVMDRENGYPGRYFVHYFNSSPKMRKFAESAGIPAEAGRTAAYVRGGKVKASLRIGGKRLIKAEAKLKSRRLKNPESGHLNYFGMKNGRVVKYPIPYLGSTRAISDPKIEITAPEGHPLHRLKPIADPTWAVWMKGSFVYPQFEYVK
ncbi:MAG: acetoacetate decarboxylase family protein [Candidatus Dadabacteria bacterium]|nr:acetoacetate decarboxylase family protein [Candidatus Dadabacteria bacterium]